MSVCDRILKVLSTPESYGLRVMPTLATSDIDALVACYDHMLQSLDATRFRQRYHYSESEGRITDLAFRADVPSYFANVHGQSIFWRKVLSIAGLRNLVAYGPTIYQQLQHKLFSGMPTSYGANEGLSLMRRVTGNVVDLDSTVLRCSDRMTVDVINASNKHKGIAHRYGNPGEFGNSEQAAEIATNCALQLIEQFVTAFKLTEEQQRNRKIHRSQFETPIHVAQDNTDRGHYPLWRYVNAGQDSFHANVPTMEDVVGALLKAPYEAARQYAFVNSGIFAGDTAAIKMDSYFEDCIVDSCFNMKWKAIEEFALTLQHEGTIVDVLQRLQKDHQRIFTMAFFEADNDEQDNEVAEMQRLAAGKMGRDQHGVVRPITATDVATWVRNPAAKI